jgi:exonuclease VII small subunit
MGALCPKPAGNQSSDSKQNVPSHKIDYSMEQCGVWKLDQLFNDASSILQEAEKYRSGLEDSPNELIEHSNVIRLREPHFAEAIKVMFWGVSANNAGDVRQSGFNISQNEPYITFTANSWSLELDYAIKAFNKYFQALVDAPKGLEEMCQKLDKLMDDISSANSTIESEMANEGMMAKMKATKHAVSNLNKLRHNVPKVKQLRPAFEKAIRELPELLKKIEVDYEEADETGKKAYLANNLALKKIFDAYHPGPFKN